MEFSIWFQFRHGLHVLLLNSLTIDLFTDTAAILNSIVLNQKLWAAEGESLENLSYTQLSG